MTAHPEQANLRLERIRQWASTGEGSLRTHLDEWAAFEVGGGLLTRGMNQRWFNNPCAKSEGARLLEYMDRLSPAAREICERGARGEGRPTAAGRPGFDLAAIDLPIGERELHQPLAQRPGALPVGKLSPVGPAVDALVEPEQHPVARVVVRERDGP